MDIDPVSSRAARARTAAEKAEREANDRIQKAAKSVREAEAENQKQIEEQRDRFERRAAGEAAQGEGRLENLRSANYEQLRKIKHQAEMDAMRTKAVAEADANKTKETYEALNHQTARAGDMRLKDLVKKNYDAFSSEQKHDLEQTEALRAQHAQSLMNLQNEQDIQLKHILNENMKTRKGLEERTLVAAEQDQQAYSDKYESAMAGHKRALQTLNSDAKAQLDSQKLSYQRRLDAYSSSRNDPFYQPIAVNAQVSEKTDHFEIRANVPAQEQGQVSVSMRGDKELVIAGHRRVEDRIQKDGRTQTSSSYQTYSESIPLSWPVDAKGMTREWDGDQIIVRIPKQNFDTSGPKRPEKKIANARMERPQFPKDLPTEAQLAKSSDTLISGVAVPDPNKKPSKRVFTDT